jgi:hypothetical protein
MMKCYEIPLGIENDDPFSATSFLSFLLPCLAIDSFIRETDDFSKK